MEREEVRMRGGGGGMKGDGVNQDAVSVKLSLLNQRLEASP